MSVVCDVTIYSRISNAIEINIFWDRMLLPVSNSVVLFEQASAVSYKTCQFWHDIYCPTLATYTESQTRIGVSNSYDLVQA